MPRSVDGGTMPLVRMYTVRIPYSSLPWTMRLVSTESARDFVLALPDELERALVGQVCERRIAERERVGERLNNVGPRRLRLFQVRSLVRIRHAGGR